MKKVESFIILVCLFSSVLAGCSLSEKVPGSQDSNKTSESSQAAAHTESSQTEAYIDKQGRLILGKIGGVEADWAIDISTTKKVAEQADLVVIGKIVSIEKTVHVGDTAYWNTYASVEPSQIFKGNAPKTFQLTTGGGYVSYDEYIKGLGATAEKLNLNFTEEEKKNGYFIFQDDDKNILESGQEYLLLLRKVKDNWYHTIGTYHGLIRIENGKAYQTQSGEGKPLDEILAEVRS